jgi:hypothetical protein
LGDLTIGDRTAYLGRHLMVKCGWLASVDFRKFHRTSLNSTITLALTVKSSSEITVTEMTALREREVVAAVLISTIG